MLICIFQGASEGIRQKADNLTIASVDFERCTRQDFAMADYLEVIPGVSKKYPLLTGNRNETIRYHNSSSEQLNLSIFNLDSHTLHLRIVRQTPEIQACKDNNYCAPKTRGFVKGPSQDLYYGSFPKHL